MKTTLVLAVLVFSLALFACGGGNGGAGGITEFADSCVATLDLDRAVCECAARKASEELSPDGFTFVIASMNSDLDTLEKVGGRLDFKEKVAASMFMAGASAECMPE